MGMRILGGVLFGYTEVILVRNGPAKDSKRWSELAWRAARDFAARISVFAPTLSELEHEESDVSRCLVHAGATPPNAFFCRASISAEVKSSTCVAIAQRNPNGSFTWP